MEWKDYEEITKYIYETLGQASGVKIEGYGNNCKVIGKSSVEHQIDVLTSHSDGLHIYKTIVECKYWDKNVNKDIIMKVAEIVEDTGLNKGVIVSKNGFTPDAISFAKYKNVGLVELREPEDEDWKGRIKDIHVEINILYPQLNVFELLIKKDTTPKLKLGSTRAEFLDIKYPNGTIESVEKYIKEFDDELCKKEENEDYDKIFNFENGTVIIYKPTNEETEIDGLKIRGTLKTVKRIIEIKGEEHVFMIMKSIFEEKSFTIMRDGEIIEENK